MGCMNSQQYNNIIRAHKNLPACVCGTSRQMNLPTIFTLNALSICLPIDSDWHPVHSKY